MAEYINIQGEINQEKVDELIGAVVEQFPTRLSWPRMRGELTFSNLLALEHRKPCRPRFNSFPIVCESSSIVCAIRF